MRADLLLGVLVVGALVGCTWGAREVKVPKEVKVPVPTACIDPARRPQKPVVRTEADLMAMERYRRTLAAWSDFKKLEIYSAELEAIVEGCSRIPRPP